MVKFIAHDAAAARAAEHERMAAASALYPIRSPEWFAECRLLELSADAEGLANCYDGFGFNWQADFWAGFPWTEPDRTASVRLVMADPRWPRLVTRFMEVHGFDLQKEFDEALRLFAI